MRHLIVVVLLLLACSVALAQDGQPEPPYIPFQGQLRNIAGELVPDSIFPMTFHLYADSTSGQPVWSETHQVNTREGLFNVFLGTLNPISLDNLSSGPLYLETQIGEQDPPLQGRLRFGSAPTSGSAQRVSGDLHTSPGIIRMFAPQPEPPIDPLVEIAAGVGGDASIRMFAPQPEPPRPNPANILNISSSPFDGASFEMFAPQAEVGMALVNANPQVRLRCDSTRSSLLLQRSRNVVGGIGDSTGVSMKADSIASSLSLFLNNSELVKISAQTIDQNPGGGLSLFSNGSEYMGIGISPFHSGGELVMSDTDGVNTIELSSLGQASFFSGGTEYMGVDPSPFGGALNMYESGGIASIQLASDGSASFFNDGTEFMGIEPVPFGGTGGVLRMYSGSPLQPRVILSSDGKLSLGTTITTNILTIQQSSSTDPIADAWTVYSSRRWKTNIQPIQNALDKVMRLNGVTYDWIENGKHDIGLIAEEVGQVVPEVVAYEENGVDAKSVDYARLTALLIEAVKDQQKTIEQLKADINELKNKEAAK